MTLDVREAVSGKLFDGRMQRVHHWSIAGGVTPDMAARSCGLKANGQTQRSVYARFASGLSDPTKGRGREYPKPTEAMLKKYLIAAALIVGFSVPAMAVETFYIMFDNTMKSGACSIMTSVPTGSKYKMMGKYSSKHAAKTAMHAMKECA